MSVTYIEAPTTPGWYRYSGGAQVMIFLRDQAGQWWVINDYGEMARCHWGYIEQALGVWDLELMVATGRAA